MNERMQFHCQSVNLVYSLDTPHGEKPKTADAAFTPAVM